MHLINETLSACGLIWRWSGCFLTSPASCSNSFLRPFSSLVSASGGFGMGGWWKQRSVSTNRLHWLIGWMCDWLFIYAGSCTYSWEVSNDIAPHLPAKPQIAIKLKKHKWLQMFFVFLPRLRDFWHEHSQSFGLLLREDADEEVGLLVRLEGGGHQQVIPRRQREALGHFSHVDVGPAASLRRMVAEEILRHVVLLIWSLHRQQ